MLADMTALGMPAWAAVAVGVLAVAAAVTDVRLARVPNWLTYPAIIIALAGHALAGGWTGRGANPGLSAAVQGFAVGFGPLLVCWLAGGVGGGDAKLMGALGALGGWRFAVATMMYGFIIVAIMAIVVMIRKKVVRRTLRRIFNAVVLLMVPGAKPADPTTPDSPKVPFAVALSAGALVAIVANILEIGGI